MDTNDPKVHFIYNERWQQVATYRQANGSNIDTHPKEQFVNHAAGLAGYGSSSYIDGVILRDDHEDDWTEAADSTMERRVYYCQNWRADVVALLAENGRIVERAWYEPYGTPHGVSPADFSGTSDDTNDHYLVPDGDADADDSFVYLDLFGLSAGLSDTTGSSDPGDPEYGRPNGTVDSDDYFYYLDVFGTAAALGRNVLSAGHDGATASHSAGNMRNRKGLAGYEWDPHVRRYHVRRRAYLPEIGRWTRRDPAGYVDGATQYDYCLRTPMRYVDSQGLCATCAGSVWAGIEPALPPSDDLGVGLSATRECAGCGWAPIGTTPFGVQFCGGASVQASCTNCECTGLNGNCKGKGCFVKTCFYGELKLTMQWHLGHKMKGLQCKTDVSIDAGELGEMRFCPQPRCHSDLQVCVGFKMGWVSCQWCSGAGWTCSMSLNLLDIGMEVGVRLQWCKTCYTSTFPPHCACWVEV